MFADDYVIIKGSRSTNLAVKAMQNALDDLYEWMQAWGFKVSGGKTVAILFNSKNKEKIKLTFSNTKLPIVQEFKFLGIYFNEDNSFKNILKNYSSDARLN